MGQLGLGVLAAAFSVLMVACGGSDEATTSQAGDTTGPVAQRAAPVVAQASFAQEAPVAVPGTRRVRIKWQGAPGAVSVWLADDQQAARMVASGLVGGSAEVDLGAAWTLDWPSARLQLRACPGFMPCLFSNPQPLVESLVDSTTQIEPDEQKLASVFSNRVALSADGRTLAVADPLDIGAIEPRPAGMGSIQIYRRHAYGGWRREAYLTNFQVAGNFGDPMALSGDGRTLIVGAYTDGGLEGGVNPPVAGGSENWTGAVYVFVRDPGQPWRQEAFLKAAEPSLYEAFGFRLAVDHTGRRIVVGGMQRQLHVFARNGLGAWQQESLIEEPAGDIDLQPSQAVALSGNGLQIASSASVLINPETGARAPTVRVYALGSGGVWNPSADLRSGKPPPPYEPFDPHSDDFGMAMAFDYSGAVLAVGAPGDYGDANDPGNDPGNLRTPRSGAVYVFATNGSTWQRQAFIKAREAAPNDQFGADVNLSADGRVLLGKACGYSGNTSGVRRNHAEGTVIGQQDDSNTQGCFWGGSGYVMTRDDAGLWRHNTSVIPVGDDLVSYGFFAIALSADASTLALGTTAYFPEGKPLSRVYVY